MDLRPSRTTIAVSDVNGRFLAQQAVLTPADPETAAVTFADKMRQLMANHPDLVFEGVGISVPGRYDFERQRVVFTPNLKWPEFDLHERLQHATGLKVEMENAANACVLAEVWFGNAEKVQNMAVVTISEGVGVGILCDGHLVRGFNGMAGEFGHVPVDPDGPLCGCGGRGCWEMYASNRAALRYYNESGPGTTGASFQFLISLAESGDSLAIKAVEQMAHAIGRGMRMIVAALAPEEIVLVGEFTRLWRRLGPIIEADLASSALIRTPPRIRPAAAEPSAARLRGSVALVLQERFSSSGSDKTRQPVAPQRAASQRC
jgi:predicted NBD/HSP70 family sugar kinase